MEHSAIRYVLIGIAFEFQNDFLTHAGFAEYHGLTEAQATALIEVAQSVRDTPHPDA